MTDAEKIERLEKVLRRLICWLIVELGNSNVERLLEMLREEKTDDQPK